MLSVTVSGLVVYCAKLRDNIRPRADDIFCYSTADCGLQHHFFRHIGFGTIPRTAIDGGISMEKSEEGTLNVVKTYRFIIYGNFWDRKIRVAIFPIVDFSVYNKLKSK